MSKIYLRQSSWLRPLLAAAAVSLASSANASLLVYESFNYGGTSVAIDGVTATGHGLTGTYSTTLTQNGTGTAEASYSTTNLTFGSNFYTTGGGSLYLRATGASSTNNASAQVFVSMNLASAQTGTLYSSYLVQFTNPTHGNDGAGAGMAINTGSANRFGSYGDLPFNNSNANRRPGVGYGATVTGRDGNSAVSANTTYLILARYTNVGEALSAGSPGVASLWLFNLAAYDAWFAAGAVEADLTSYSTSWVTQSATSGSFDFQEDYLIRLMASSGQNGTSGTMGAYIDELRWGTTLSDVVAVPEPSTSAALAGIALLGFAALRRRR